MHGLLPRRIVIVSDAWYPQINGVVRVLDTLRLRLEARGHTVEILAPDRFRAVPCPTYPEIPLCILPGRRLGRLLADFAPQAVHIATEGPLGMAARAWCRRRGHPFTSAYHTKFPEYVHARTRLPLPWLYAAMRRFHAPSSAVLAPSPSVYRELTAQAFANVRPWSHGVDAQVFQPRGKNYLDLPRPIHLFVGRLAVEKNLPAFLSLDLPGSKVVVGSGPQRDELMRAFPDAHFRQARGDGELARYFSAADVFVFPSRTDTFGLTMLEALACGVPVAAFPVTGPLDVLGLDGPGETPAGCLDADLAGAVRRARAKDPADCRAHALEFSWERVVDQFLAHLAPF
ncbi:MAG: glycosyltransferase family 1 protein [Hyphomicrobiales bacterium]|nr:glycosyltransferase family 1 protein [Hyphomicrobiales bacterium]